MAEVIMKSRIKAMSKLKLFITIEGLSNSCFAKIKFYETDAHISFFSRPGLEFVCKWKFEKIYYNEELKILFHKHNSSIAEERKEH